MFLTRMKENQEKRLLKAPNRHTYYTRTVRFGNLLERSITLHKVRGPSHRSAVPCIDTRHSSHGNAAFQESRYYLDQGHGYHTRVLTPLFYSMHV